MLVIVEFPTTLFNRQILSWVLSCYAINLVTHLSLGSSSVNSVCVSSTKTSCYSDSLCNSMYSLSIDYSLIYLPLHNSILLSHINSNDHVIFHS